MDSTFGYDEQPTQHVLSYEAQGYVFLLMLLKWKKGNTSISRAYVWQKNTSGGREFTYIYPETIQSSSKFTPQTIQFCK